MNPAPATHRLMGKSSAPLRIVRGDPGRARIALGRLLETKDAKTRASARLAQRIAQEQLDARLTLAGTHGLFGVTASLSSRRADQEVQRVVETLGELGTTRQPQQRLFQAARLWLGARVVQASLQGEDWTALFSEALDLSDRDASIPGALAADARAMLAVTAQELQTWVGTWLNPRSGQGGWAWVVSGADEVLLRRLSRVAAIEHA